MRVLHVVPTYWPAVRYGGPIVSVHALARAQAQLGHSVEVFTTNVDGAGVSDVPIGQLVEKDGVGVSYFATGVGRRVYRSPEMGNALRTRAPDFDVVHVHAIFLWPTVAACREAVRARRGLVLSPRGMLVPELVRRKSAWIKSAWLHVFGGQTIGKAGVIHATSEVEAEDIRRMKVGAQTISVVPNGIDVGEALATRGPFRTSAPRIVTIGRINWKKGLERLVATLKTVDDAELLIAGNDEEGHQAVLEKCFRDGGVADRVQFLGAVHGDAKWRLLADADLFVAPSLSENFGNAVLEAMAAGTPVVTTPEVGLAEAVRASGAGVVVDGDPRTLASAIASLVRDRSTLEGMSSAGRRIARGEFSWASVASRMDRLYADAQSTAAAFDGTRRT